MAHDAVAELHDADYADFLEAITAELAEGDHYIPSLFHHDLADAPIRFQGGRYCNEIGTPIGAGTLKAALNSAAAAQAAAEYTAKTDGDSFALCRPPGHHAGRRRYGGYCFFNNAYVAARILSKAGHAPVVLDIDYHIGDGSIEFADEAAPYVSLHADTVTTYPYLGSLPERPAAQVSLINLKEGIDVGGYINQLIAVLETISKTGSQLVLSLGFDLLADDFIQDVPTSIQAADFEPIGAAIGKLKMPVTMVLEGGYNKDRLADCTQAFFTGFMPTRG